MKKPIKRISSDLIEEGVSIDLLNSIDLARKCSPVIIAKDSEPVRLLICSSGFNVILDDGSILRDSSNKPIILKEKDCLIGRARYLVKYGQKDKAERVQELVDSWKSSVRSFLNQVKKKIEALERSVQDDSSNNFIKIISQDKWPATKANLETELLNLKPAYLKAEEMFSENKIIELLSSCGLKEFSNPMLSVRLDNQKEMNMLINVFGRQAIEKWNGDMLIKYAEIEIEKSWPN